MGRCGQALAIEVFEHSFAQESPRKRWAFCFAGEKVWHIVGRLILALTAVAIGVNALFMLISPRAWFRLPDWIRAQGSLTEKKFGSGWGAIQVRITGALGLGVIVWVLYDSLLRHR
jgi:hypothetical protein